MRKKAKKAEEPVKRQDVSRTAKIRSGSAKEKIPQGLCFRCEHRAGYLEKKHRPRFECGMTKGTVCSCYMYQPVKPLVLDRSEKRDLRPILSSPMISARVSGVRIASGVAVAKKTKDGIIVSWQRLR